MFRRINTEAVDIEFLHKGVDVGLVFRAYDWVRGVYVWKREIGVAQPSING